MPSFTAAEISAASRWRDSASSSNVPPSLIRIFTLSSYQAGRFLAAQHQVHVLDGLSGGALHQIVDSADDNGAAGGGIELESDIAEVGAIHARQIGQAAGRIEPHEFFGLVMAKIDIEQFVRRLDIARAQIDGFQDSPFDG